MRIGQRVRCHHRRAALGRADAPVELSSTCITLSLEDSNRSLGEVTSTLGQLGAFVCAVRVSRLGGGLASASVDMEVRDLQHLTECAAMLLRLPAVRNVELEA